MRRESPATYGQDGAHPPSSVLTASFGVCAREPIGRAQPHVRTTARTRAQAELRREVEGRAEAPLLANFTNVSVGNTSVELWWDFLAAGSAANAANHTFIPGTPPPPSPPPHNTHTPPHTHKSHTAASESGAHARRASSLTAPRLVSKAKPWSYGGTAGAHVWNLYMNRVLIQSSARAHASVSQLRPNATYSFQVRPLPPVCLSAVIAVATLRCDYAALHDLLHSWPLHCISDSKSLTAPRCCDRAV